MDASRGIVYISIATEDDSQDAQTKHHHGEQNVVGEQEEGTGKNDRDNGMVVLREEVDLVADHLEHRAAVAGFVFV